MDIMTILGISFVGLSVFLIYLLTQVPRSYKLKFLAVPLLMTLACSFIFELPKVLGLPKDGYPEHQFSLVGYKLAFDHHQHLMIETWVTEEGNSRLYQFPFDEKIAKQLQQMAEQGAGGRHVKGQFKHGKGLDSGTGDSMELGYVEIPFQPLPLKPSG